MKRAQIQSVKEPVNLMRKPKDINRPNIIISQRKTKPMLVRLCTRHVGDESHINNTAVHSMRSSSEGGTEQVRQVCHTVRHTVHLQWRLTDTW